MNTSLINNILLIARIIIPITLCVLLIPIMTNTNLEALIILVFSIAIILFNYNKTKYNFILSFLISIILSYAVYFLSIVILGIIKFIFMGGDIDKKIEGSILGIDLNHILLLIPLTIISPLLMFYSYKIIFNINNLNYFRTIKWVAITILIVVGIVSDYYNNGNLYTSWQFVMLFALQLILYQKELQVLFSSKKGV